MQSFKKFFKVTVLIYSSIFFQACASMGSPFTFKGPESITVGKTTQRQIEIRYGTPFRVGYENGYKKWTYGYYQYRLFGHSNTKDLSITFDKNNVVKDYSYSSSEPKEVKDELE